MCAGIPAVVEGLACFPWTVVLFGPDRVTEPVSEDTGLPHILLRLSYAHGSG